MRPPAPLPPFPLTPPFRVFLKVSFYFRQHYMQGDEHRAKPGTETITIVALPKSYFMMSLAADIRWMNTETLCQITASDMHVGVERTDAHQTAVAAFYETQDLNHTRYGDGSRGTKKAICRLQVFQEDGEGVYARVWDGRSRVAAALKRELAMCPVEVEYTTDVKPGMINIKDVQSYKCTEVLQEIAVMTIIPNAIRKPSKTRSPKKKIGKQVVLCMHTTGNLC